MAYKSSVERIFIWEVFKNTAFFWIFAPMVFFLFTLPYMAEVRAGFDRLDPDEVAAMQKREEHRAEAEARERQEQELERITAIKVQHEAERAAWENMRGDFMARECPDFKAPPYDPNGFSVFMCHTPDGGFLGYYVIRDQWESKNPPPPYYSEELRNADWATFSRENCVARYGQDPNECFFKEDGNVYKMYEGDLKKRWEAERPIQREIEEAPPAFYLPHVTSDSVALMMEERAGASTYTKATAKKHFFVSAALFFGVVGFLVSSLPLSFVSWGARFAWLENIVGGLRFSPLVFIGGLAGVWFFSLGLKPLLMVAPLACIFVPVYLYVGWEIIKETEFYRRLFILGRRGHDSRLAGVLSFIRGDIGGFFARNLAKIDKTATSNVYLGKTRYMDDYKAGGRHVAIKDSEVHLLTIAGTGSGKSRDAIWNNLLTYAGGIIGFDPKGEHVRVCKKRREQYAPFYVLDPYGQVSDIAPSAIWNPLDEIDTDGEAAREYIGRLADASIYQESREDGSSSFFREMSSKMLRGFIGHVKTRYPKEKQHLGTVYDLICTGEEGGEFFDAKAFENLLLEMMTNSAIQGIARDAASAWMQSDPRQRSGFMSTMRRGVDWMNIKSVRAVTTGRSTFSIREAKTREASIFLVCPEDFIGELSRFMRTFYQITLAMLDNHVTPQPKGSKRRVLVLFDEANKLGSFKPIEDALLLKRSSFLKLWIIYQNMGQISDNFNNPDNILGSCDFQIFGVAAHDEKAPPLLEKMLGNYTDIDTEQGRRTETVKPVIAAGTITELLNAGSNYQLVFKVGSRHPLLLERVPYYRNFNEGQYGDRENPKKQTSRF